MADFPLTSNAGQFKVITGANPAANNEVTDTVPIAANEVQTISGTPSATFSLSADGFTGPVTLSTTATAADVQAYLNAFPQYNYGSGAVVCTGGPLPGAITITYSGAPKAGQNVSQPAVANGATGITITTTTQGTQSKAWLLVCVKLTLVQGATQTPQPILQIDDGSTVYFEAFGSSAAQAASTTCVYTFGPNMPLTGQIGATTNVHSTAPLADDLLLLPGHRIKTSTIGIGANTDYGSAIYYVCELG